MELIYHYKINCKRCGSRKEHIYGHETKQRRDGENVYEHGFGRRSSRSVRTLLSAVTGAFAATVAIDSDPASVAIDSPFCIGCGESFVFINKET